MVIQVGQTRQKKKKKIKIKCKIAKKKNFDNWPLQVTVTLLSLVRHVQGISYRWWFPFHLLNLQTAPAKQRYSPQRSEAHHWKRSRLTSIMRWASSDLSSSPSISRPFSDIPAKGPCRGWHRYNPQELQHPISRPDWKERQWEPSRDCQKTGRLIGSIQQSYGSRSRDKDVGTTRQKAFNDLDKPVP